MTKTAKFLTSHVLASLFTLFLDPLVIHFAWGKLAEKFFPFVPEVYRQASYWEIFWAVLLFRFVTDVIFCVKIKHHKMGSPEKALDVSG